MQIEVKGLQTEMKRLKTAIIEVGKSNVSLETKLRISIEERDGLTQQNRKLLTAKKVLKEKFDSFVHETQEQLSQLTDTADSKTDEIEQLNETVKRTAEELELTKFQVSISPILPIIFYIGFSLLTYLVLVYLHIYTHREKI